MFLDFISYSGGPLPEDLLRDAPCPVSILWGESFPLNLILCTSLAVKRCQSCQARILTAAVSRRQGPMGEGRVGKGVREV